MRTCSWGALFVFFSCCLLILYFQFIFCEVFSPIHPTYCLFSILFFLSSSVMGDRISSSIQDLCPHPPRFILSQ